MYLALTYDHRLLDGREAVTFLVKVCGILVLTLRFSCANYIITDQGVYRGPASHVARLNSAVGVLFNPRGMPLHKLTTSLCSGPCWVVMYIISLGMGAMWRVRDRWQMKIHIHFFLSLLRLIDSMSDPNRGS